LTKTKFGSPAVFGIVISAVASGGLLGALLAGVWKIRRRGLLILVVSVVLGLCLGGIGLLGKVWSIASVLLSWAQARDGQRPHQRMGYARIDAAMRGRAASVLMPRLLWNNTHLLAVAGF